MPQIIYSHAAPHFLSKCKQYTQKFLCGSIETASARNCRASIEFVACVFATTRLTLRQNACKSPFASNVVRARACALTLRHYETLIKTYERASERAEHPRRHILILFFPRARASFYFIKRDWNGATTPFCRFAFIFSGFFENFRK